MKSILVIFFLFVFLSNVKSQILDSGFVYGQFLIQVKDYQTLQDFILKANQSEKYKNKLTVKSNLAPELGVYLLEFDTAQINQLEYLTYLRSIPGYIAIQNNHFVKQRITPNDSLFPQMWAMENTGQLGGTVGADIKAKLAWNITTGGLTSTGDTIIVAVIDGGFYLPHNDLSFWKNYAEIPGDTIDNDNNGYIDDYNGWNAYNDSPLNSSNNTHGTHVAGTVGAKGNNVIGVTGVNWNVKIMPVAGSSDVESVVVRAYNYVLKQRKIYNQTNGMSGAFVVSTNASFGKDYGQPANYPIWCAIYDSLGKQGILSAAATANLNINVDVQGDIPTTCPSNYLIAVTNTTRTDLKYSSAAYGLNSIDLGAPGTSIYSTYPANSYSTSTGTSMASPHVAGAIALMISAASPQQIAEYKLKPDSMALVFKQMLLCGVDVKSDLTGKTVTGGRLNLYNAVLNVVNNDVCVTANTVAPIKNANKLSLYSLYPNPLINSNTVNITYYAPQTNLKIQIYNQVGQLIHTLILQPSSWGFKSHLIDLPNLESGIYWIKLVKNNDAETSNTLPVVIIK